MNIVQNLFNRNDNVISIPQLTAFNPALMSLTNTPSCDYHVHIGRYHEYYFHPEAIANELLTLGVQYWFVSSISTCTADIDFGKIVAEFEILFNIAPIQVQPVLWVTPRMLEQSPDLTLFDKFQWKMLKIHPYAHNWENDYNVHRICSIARDREIPLLIHTGGSPQSDADRFKEICLSYYDVSFQLAHCRPTDSAIKLISNSSNVTGDISFASIESIQKIVDAGISGKLVFGSDYPLDTIFYPNEERTKRYKERWSELCSIFGTEMATNWASLKK